VLLEDVVLAFVVDVYVGSLNISKTCRLLVSGNVDEGLGHTFKLPL